MYAFVMPHECNGVSDLRKCVTFRHFKFTKPRVIFPSDKYDYLRWTKLFIITPRYNRISDWPIDVTCDGTKHRALLTRYISPSRGLSVFRYNKYFKMFRTKSNVKTTMPLYFWYNKQCIGHLCRIDWFSKHVRSTHFSNYIHVCMLLM